MAACHPQLPLQHLQHHPQLQQESNATIGLGGITGLNGIATQGQQIHQQTHYPHPHRLNWVYLTIADQNPQPDQV